MATKSSYLLAVLLIANPFMLLVFQNCSGNVNERSIASADSAVQVEIKENPEFTEKINNKLIIR